MKEKIAETSVPPTRTPGGGVGECPFCPMFTEGGPDVIDIEPLNPVVPGHRIVIPRKHVSDFAQDSLVTSEVMHHAVAAATEMGDCNLITSKGVNATQSVFHLHVHVVPRSDGDGLMLPWSDTSPLVAATYARGREDERLDPDRAEKLGYVIGGLKVLRHIQLDEPKKDGIIDELIKVAESLSPQSHE